MLLKNFFEENRFTIVTNISSDFKSPINLTNVPILIALYNTTGDPIDIDPKLFSFRVEIFKTLITYGPEGRKVYDFDFPVSTIRCDYLKDQDPEFLEMFSRVYVGMNFSRYMCISPGEDLSIYGTIGDIRNGWQGFRVFVDKCKNNETHPEYCYNETIKNEMINGTEVAFGFEGATINTLAKESIKKEVYSVGGDKVDLSYTRRYYHRISKGLYKEDHGILYAKYQETEFFTMEDKTEEMDLFQTADYFGYIQFNTNGRYNTVIKTPQNVASFIGTIGGLVNAIYMVLSTAITLIYDKFLVVDIMNMFADKHKISALYHGKKAERNGEITHLNSLIRRRNENGINPNIGGESALAGNTIINNSGVPLGNITGINQSEIAVIPENNNLPMNNADKSKEEILNINRRPRERESQSAIGAIGQLNIPARRIINHYSNYDSDYSNSSLDEVAAKYNLREANRIKEYVSQINNHMIRYIICPFSIQKIYKPYKDKILLYFSFNEYFDIQQFYVLKKIEHLVKKTRENQNG